MPSSASTRLRRPVSPPPSGSAPPRPSSRTSTLAGGPARARPARARGCAPRRAWPTLASASADDEVGGRLDGRRQPPVEVARRPSVGTPRARPRATSIAVAQAALGEQRRADARARGRAARRARACASSRASPTSAARRRGRRPAASARRSRAPSRARRAAPARRRAGRARCARSSRRAASTAPARVSCRCSTRRSSSRARRGRADRRRSPPTRPRCRGRAARRPGSRTMPAPARMRGVGPVSTCQRPVSQPSGSAHHQAGNVMKPSVIVRRSSSTVNATIADRQQQQRVGEVAPHLAVAGRGP